MEKSKRSFDLLSVISFFVFVCVNRTSTAMDRYVVFLILYSECHNPSSCWRSTFRVTFHHSALTTNWSRNPCRCWAKEQKLDTRAQNGWWCNSNFFVGVPKMPWRFSAHIHTKTNMEKSSKNKIKYVQYLLMGKSMELNGPRFVLLFFAGLSFFFTSYIILCDGPFGSHK